MSVIVGSNPTPSAPDPDPPAGPDRIRIATVQTQVTLDPALNGRTVRQALRQAAAGGARLAHFCEGALTGYAVQAKEVLDGWRVDWAPVRDELSRTARLAGELGLWVVMGGNHRVDCVLFSTFSEDPIFDVLARGHAAANGYWVSVAVPAQHSDAMPSGVIGPHGYRLAGAPTDRQPSVVLVDLDRADPALDVALHKARPWRHLARSGAPYESRRVSDPRSTDRTII